MNDGVRKFVVILEPDERVGFAFIVRHYPVAPARGRIEMTLWQ